MPVAQSEKWGGMASAMPLDALQIRALAPDRSLSRLQPLTITFASSISILSASPGRSALIRDSPIRNAS